MLELLEHRHFWVQKAAARALGAAFAAPPLAAVLYALPQLPGRAALHLFTHFEACSGDAAALTQAVKCLVATTAALYDAEVAEHGGGLAELGDFRAAAAETAADARQDGAQPGPQERPQSSTGQNGSVPEEGSTHQKEEGGMDTDSADENATGVGEEGEEEAWEEEDAAAEEEQAGRRPRALTVRGLFKRMGRHAVDRREVAVPLRLAALQWLAAAVRALGGGRLAAHGGALVAAAARPLHRIQAAAGLDGEEVRSSRPCCAACDVPAELEVDS